MHSSALFLLAGVASVAAAQSARNTDRQMPPAPTVSGLSVSAQRAMQAIDPAKVRYHVRFLSLDLLEGRGTGARGGNIAAEYMGTQFALLGLKPAGDHGTYMQRVPLVAITTQPQSTFALVAKNGKTLNLRKDDDFVATNESLTPEVEVEAPIVFVGYGINAPEYHWNDYQDADVKGKVALMFVNEPPSPLPSTDANFFQGKALTYYGRWTYKLEEAARQGAVGAILIHQTQMASYGWEVVRNSWGGERSYLAANPAPKLQSAAWIQFEVARQLFSASGLDIDKEMQQMRGRGFKAVDLGATLRAHLVSSVRPFDGYNVIGKLDGSHPARGNQAVLYTAHYDHLGIHPQQPGDNIYNGADDNASGCAILLEIARAFANADPKPARSLIFASVTAEEQGLLGSAYLGLHPPVPAKDIMLNLNFDNIAPLGVPQELVSSGYERTTFAPVVEQVAAAFKMKIRPDAFPEAGHYYRSDHFSLARVGVPAFSLGEGLKFVGHDIAWGEAMAKDYLEHHYHQPSDEYRPEMDFRADAQLARVGFALGWRAAQQAAPIGWKPGDEFERARKQSQAQ